MTNTTGKWFDHAVDQGASWLLRSGIQNREGEPRARGGVNAWYDPARHRYAFVYSEITGYYLTALAYLNAVGLAPDYLQAARSAGDWLTDEARDREAGWFRCRYEVDRSSFVERGYAFDDAMVLNGLVNLLRATNDTKYRVASEDAALSLVRGWQHQDGSFEPYKPPDADSRAVVRPWSKQPGSFMAKHAIGLLNASDLTGNMEMREGAISACDRALLWQQPDGRFITSEPDGRTHLHPHLYSCEGLWAAGTMIGREDYLTAATRGVRWALDNQLPSGGVPRFLTDGAFNACERTDVTSQTLRLGSVLVGEGRLPERYAANLGRAAERLRTFWCSEGEPQERGGFRFGFQSNGLAADHVNSWCTMFSVQALSVFSRLQSGTPGLDWRLLV